MDPKKLYSLIGRSASLYDVGLSLVGYEKSVEYFVSCLPFGKEVSIRVLDAGCGTGLYSLQVLKRYNHARITAFDFDNQLVRRLEEKIREKNYENRTHTFSGDIQGSLKEIRDERFDLVITSGVLEYVPLERTIKNLSRFPASGGYFLNSSVRDTWWGRLVCKIYGCKPYTREENIKAFEKNGFHLEKIINVSPYVPASFKEAHLFKKTN
jgi:ubiquinone/menaquinone biosynthesis C-methylase UbiE